MPPFVFVREEDLHAWLDGELPPARRALVAAYLLARPAERRRLAAYGDDGEAIGRLFGGVVEPWPSPSAAHRPPVWRRAAAAILLLLAGAAAGWQAADRRPGAEPFVREATAAHTIFAAVGAKAAALEIGDAARLVATLSNALGAPVELPRLRDLGYRLAAARQLSSASETAVQLVYRGTQGGGAPVSIFFRAKPGATETPFRLSRDGDVATLSWDDDDLTCAISGEVEPAVLEAVGHRLYAALQSCQPPAAADEPCPTATAGAHGAATP